MLNALRGGLSRTCQGVVGAWIHQVVGLAVKDEGPTLEPGRAPAASQRLQERPTPEVLMDVDRPGGPAVNRFSDTV